MRVVKFHPVLMTLLSSDRYALSRNDFNRENILCVIPLAVSVARVRNRKISFFWARNRRRVRTEGREKRKLKHVKVVNDVFKNIPRSGSRGVV